MAAVVAPRPGERARPAGARAGGRRRLARRHRRRGRARPGPRWSAMRRQPGARARRCGAGLAEARRRGRRGRGLLRRRRRVRPRGARARWSPRSWTGRADYVVGSRFDGRIAHMRPHRRARQPRAHLALSLRGAPPADRRRRAATGPSRRAAAARRRDRPRLQLRPGADARPAGQGLRATPRCRSATASASTGRSFVRLGPYLRRVVPGRLPRAERGAPAQSSTTCAAKRSRAAAQPGASKEPSRPRQSAAAQAMASAWWALSWTKRPCRPSVSSAGWAAAQASRAGHGSPRSRLAGWVGVRQAHDLDLGRARTREARLDQPVGHHPAQLVVARAHRSRRRRRRGSRRTAPCARPDRRRRGSSSARTRASRACAPAGR